MRLLGILLSSIVFLLLATPSSAYFFDEFNGTFDASNVSFTGSCVGSEVETPDPNGSIKFDSDNIVGGIFGEHIRAVYLYNATKQNLVKHWWQDLAGNSNHPYCIIGGGGTCFLDNSNTTGASPVTGYDPFCAPNDEYKIMIQNWNGNGAEEYYSNQVFTFEQVYPDSTLTPSPTPTPTPTPAPTIANLIAIVQQLNLQQGIQNSLDSKLQAAQDALNAQNNGQSSTAVNKLNAFINEVEAQRGTKLINAQADQLHTFAQSLINLIQGN